MIAIYEQEATNLIESYDEAIKYKTSFFYCSPNDDNWSLQIDIVEDRVGIFRKIKITQVWSAYKSVRRHFLPGCNNHLIIEKPQDINSVIRNMQANISRTQAEMTEPMPRIMMMKSNEIAGDYWVAIFRKRSAYFALGVITDDNGSELKKVDQYRILTLGKLTLLVSILNHQKIQAIRL